jgi:hypothetical protein
LRKEEEGGKYMMRVHAKRKAENKDDMSTSKASLAAQQDKLRK